MEIAGDPDSEPIFLNLISDGSGAGSLALSIHPSNSSIVYIAMPSSDADLWRGDFSTFDTIGKATWNQLASPKNGGAYGTTPSGCTFVLPYLQKVVLTRDLLPIQFNVLGTPILDAYYNESQGLNNIIAATSDGKLHHYYWSPTERSLYVSTSNRGLLKLDFVNT